MRGHADLTERPCLLTAVVPAGFPHLHIVTPHRGVAEIFRWRSHLTNPHPFQPHQTMFRLALRSAARPVFRAPVALRTYVAPPISIDEVTKRAFEALKTVAAVDESKLSLEANFQKDLGLDSLDTVEALVALEEEFELEIPDKISDEIKTVGEAIDYIYAEEQKF